MLLGALNNSGAGQDSVRMIESTTVRAHQHVAGAQKRQALRAGVFGGLSTMALLRTNVLGLTVASVLIGGEVSDTKG